MMELVAVMDWVLEWHATEPPQHANAEPVMDRIFLRIRTVRIINKAFQSQLIIPKFEEFCDDISDIYEKVDMA